MKLTNSSTKAVNLFLTFLLLNILLAALVTTDYFYEPQSSPYYAFTFFSLMLIISATIYKSDKNTFLNPINILFGIWCMYILIRFADNAASAQITIQMITLYLLLNVSTSLLKTKVININILLYGIAVIAALESVFCILQFFGFVESKNNFYTVTGTWNNPNVTAIFLSLTLPVNFFLLRSRFRNLIILNIVSLAAVLLMLKCRTAFIGFFVCSLIYYSLEFRLLDWTRNKKNKNSLKALIVLAILVLTPTCISLYNAKKESADGRKFIWNLSLEMALEKPLTGYGYGNFEKEYNLFQADYIRKGAASDEEIRNAGPVIMPHNEIIHNLAEGGIIGLFLACSFFTSLFLRFKNEKTNIENSIPVQTVRSSNKKIMGVAYAGAGSFIAMSMVNSTLQIIPLIFMLIIYSSIISSMHQPVQVISQNITLKRNRIASLFSMFSVICLCVYLLYTITSTAYSDRLNQKAATLRNAKRSKEALLVMPGLEKKIGTQSLYWENYGRIYMDLGEYSKAIYYFEKAKKASSLPELYSCSGVCYEKMNQYPQAIKEYEMLTALDPSRFVYRMALLQVYLKNRNTEEALNLATQIIKMKPKIPSEKVNSYKNICHNLLKIASIQKQKSPF